MQFSHIGHHQLTDSMLLVQLGQGDGDSLRELHDRYADFLYRLAMKRLPVAYKAEDLVQEVFLTLYRKREQLTDITDLRAWLSSCLRNSILNEIRNTRIHSLHHTKIASTQLNSEFITEQHDVKLLEKTFHKTLADLTDRCREVFVLSRMDELSNKNIAEKLNCSVKAVEKQITKALRILRNELGEHGVGIILLLTWFYNYSLFS